jgi:predicted nucleotidyltransferase
MTQPLPPTLPSTLERLIRALAPERIVLFGSRARGTARANSDIDCW